MTERAGKRRAGLLAPLFSCPSEASWGIGEIGDVVPLTKWLAASGQRVLQLLPLNEMAPGQQSPYSAISAMAIDPIFISLRDVPEWRALGDQSAIVPEGDLDEVRRSPVIAHEAVRRLKRAALRAAFTRFRDVEWCRGTERGSDQ